MKKNISIFISCLFLSGVGFAQDSTRSESHTTYKTDPQVKSVVIPAKKYHTDGSAVHYRPTRLGSSSPVYNTYEKNDFGAGAVTTNPNKSGSAASTINPEVPPNNSSNSGIRRDTRLGSSSPLYDSYKKNDYGAGAITTNPNKTGGGANVIINPAQDTMHVHSDTTRNF